jgi:hypothetical protein
MAQTMNRRQLKKGSSDLGRKRRLVTPVDASGLGRKKMGEMEEEGQIGPWVPSPMQCGGVLDATTTHVRYPE